MAMGFMGKLLSSVCAQSGAKSRKHHTTATNLLQSAAKSVEAHKKTSAETADVHKKCLDFSVPIW
jgi:hypothetical protein